MLNKTFKFIPLNILSNSATYIYGVCHNLEVNENESALTIPLIMGLNPK